MMNSTALSDLELSIPVNVGKPSVEYDCAFAINKIDPCFDDLTLKEEDYKSPKFDDLGDQFLPELSDDSDSDEFEYDAKYPIHTSSAGIECRSPGTPDTAELNVKPDDYLFCPSCCHWVVHDCSLHRTDFVENTAEYISADGTFLEPLPANTVIGPCQGRIVEVEEGAVIDDSYLWEIDLFSSTRRLIFRDAPISHWSNNVLYSPDVLESNAYALQYGGQIYFRVLPLVAVGERLLVYQGDRRGSYKGHPIGKYNESVGEQGKKRKFKKFRHYHRIDGDEPSWQCRSCSFQTDVYSRIRYHSKMAHRSPDDKFICKICAKQLSSSSSLSGHMRTHKTGLDSRRFVCAICSSSFQFKHHLKRHELFRHGVEKRVDENSTKKRVHECPKCHNMLPNKGSLVRHMKNAHNEDAGPNEKEKPAELPATCPHCEKVLKNCVALKVHVAKAHPDMDDSKVTSHVCGHCFKCFGNKSTLRYHLMRHTGEFPFKCEKCGYGYPTLSELRKHEKKSKKCAKEPTIPPVPEGQ